MLPYWMSGNRMNAYMQEQFEKWWIETYRPTEMKDGMKRYQENEDILHLIMYYFSMSTLILHKAIKKKMCKNKQIYK